MEVAKQQVEWEREEVEENEDELLTRRQRRPEIINEEEQEGSNSSYENFVPENGKSEDEPSMPENGKYQDEHSALENVKSQNEHFVPEISATKDEFAVPENSISKDEQSVPENGQSKDEHSTLEICEAQDEHSVPEIKKTKDELVVPENGKTKDELMVPEKSHVQVSDYEENGKVESTLVNNQYQYDVEDDNNSLPDIELLLKEKPVEYPKATQSSSHMIGAGSDTEVLDDSEGLYDIDVEKVIQEQNTHDLICPNCHTCITRKVILRKRKRNVKIDVAGKRNKPEVEDKSQLDVISENTTDNQGHTTVVSTADSSSQTLGTEEYNRETEQGVFCLSCFTFFIPTVLSSLFSRKKETSVNKDFVGNVDVVSRQKVDSSQSVLVISSSPEDRQATGNIGANTGEKFKVGKEVTDVIGPAVNHLETLLPGKGTQHGEILEEFNIPHRVGMQILDEPPTEVSALDTSLPDQKLNTVNGINGTDDKNWLFPGPTSIYEESANKKPLDLVTDFSSQNGENIGVRQAMPGSSTVEVRNVEVTFSDTSYSCGSPHNNSGTKVDIHIEKTTTANSDASRPSLITPLLLPDIAVNTTKDSMSVSQHTSSGNDTIITVTESQTTPQQAQDIITSVGTDLSLPDCTINGEFKGVEVIKSIVYGGLVEVVTSLGVVSSAAGSDTAIISIVALAMANLFGGLFTISHHLWNLKDNDRGLVSNQVNENAPDQRTRRIDKYQELLGRRENFSLHATVAILSYLIFGLVPPVIYGFSFRQTNDRDYKLLATAVASLLCIIVLAVGKAYVQGPPKPYVKMIFYYIALGFMASGVSYVAGDLVKRLIEKLGWLGSGTDLSVPIMRKLPMQTGLSFY